MSPPVHADFRRPGTQDLPKTQSPAGHESHGCLSATRQGNATLQGSCQTTSGTVTSTLIK